MAPRKHLVHMFSRLSISLSRAPHVPARPVPSKEEAAEPLMGDEESLSGTHRRRKATPLPMRQLIIICCMRMTEPVAFMLIFPFINEMIVHVGGTNDPQNVGYYSGMVEGAFALAQFCTALWWGRLSDRIGRRPVLLLGMIGLVFSTILFGFSRSITAMIFARVLSGLLNGNVGVLKSAVGEMTDSSNRPQAFAFLPLTWFIGSGIAPIIGGFLARPVDRFPSLFGGWTLFIEYPYLLPCLAGAAITGAGFIFGLIYLEETLAGKRTVQYGDKDDMPMTPLSPVAPMSEAPQEPPSIAAVLALPRVRNVLLNLAFMAWTSVSIEACWVLFLYTPIQVGGLGFSGPQIGLTMSSNALAAIFANLVFFPRLVRRFGTVTVYLATMSLHALIILLMPVTHAFAAAGAQAPTLWCVALLVGVRCIAGLVFPCNMIFVNVAAPSTAALGTMNGLAQMVGSGMRGIGPGIATTLFALTMSHKLLGGYLVWAFQLMLCIVWIWLASDIRRHNFDEDE